MIYGGFDLTFIDVDIRPTNTEDGNLISELPAFGTHHRNTVVGLRPGGNGFNLCRTLASLGRDVTYVGPSSTLLENLVKDIKIPLKILPIENTEVNLTAILNMQEGEIQFNSVKGNLSFEHLNEKLLEAYISSPLKSISNVSLNPTSIEWTCALLMSLIDVNLTLNMTKTSTFFEILQNKDEINYEGVIFIDPCDVSHFSRLDEFIEILRLLKKFKGEKYLSVNEYELKTILHHLNKTPKEAFEFLDLPIINHSSKEVKYYGEKNFKYPTKEIKNPVTFVGAGDCFNGGFLHSIFDSNSVEDSILFAIESASHLIKTGNFPT